MPRIDLTGDHHVHTRLCLHASDEMEDYVRAALDRGLKSLTFLEHLECGIIYDHRTWLTAEDFRLYFREGRRLQRLYRDRLQIRLGVELGYNPGALQELKDVLNKFPFEQIGLSYHYLFDGSRHLNMVSRRQNNLDALQAHGIDRVLDAYFSGLLKAVDQLPCDKICHLDAVLRHLPDIHFTKYHRQQIELLLERMAEKTIALEINTSGFAHRSSPYPAPDIVALALKKGIPLVAGSDAHHPEQVGRHFARLARSLA